MVQQDYDHPYECEITCSNCGAKNKVGVDQLRFKNDMKPYVCDICAKGIEVGDICKLKKFMIDNFEVTNIVDSIIDKLKIDYIELMKNIEKNSPFKCSIALNKLNKPLVVMHGEETIGFDIEQIGANETIDSLTIKILERYILEINSNLDMVNLTS